MYGELTVILLSQLKVGANPCFRQQMVLTWMPEELKELKETERKH